MRSLEERQIALEQKKARLADTESRLKLAEKKAHTRRIYAVAELLVKTSLLQEDEATLYGAFLEIQEGMRDSKARAQWRLSGLKALESDKRDSEQNHEPVVLTFKDQPNRELALRLKEAGFRFNKILRHWEGVTSFEDAEQLALTYHGCARRYGDVGTPSLRTEDGVTSTQTELAPHEQDRSAA